ncbi:MAG: ACT domain-containing protein [Actinomycetota bacterium]
MTEPVRALDQLLDGLTASRRAGAFTVVMLPEPPELDDAQAVVREDEGWTVVVTEEVARARGWDGDGRWAWLTLDVHSSLDAVGLTAAVSTALAEASVPCNVIAGAVHDHLLVPAVDADRAVAAIAALAAM